MEVTLKVRKNVGYLTKLYIYIDEDVAETAIVNYRLSYADHGKQTSIFRFCLKQTNRSSAVFVFCLQQTNRSWCFSVSSAFRSSMYKHTMEMNMKIDMNIKMNIDVDQNMDMDMEKDMEKWTKP